VQPPRLVLAEHALPGATIDRLELALPEALALDGVTDAHQLRDVRTTLRLASARIPPAAVVALAERVATSARARGVERVEFVAAHEHLAVRARVRSNLASTDLTFRIWLVAAGPSVRVVATDVLAHGPTTTPAPALAHALLVDTAAQLGRHHVRGLCDVELQALDALLWGALPAHGWRLPDVRDVIAVAASISPAGIGLGFLRSSLDVRDRSRPPAPPAALRPHLTAHDAMRAADEAVRAGALDEAMRLYRALLASGSLAEPLPLVERILALAVHRPAWHGDGLELARQATQRWPAAAGPASALASLELAAGDAGASARARARVVEVCATSGDAVAAAAAAAAAATTFELAGDLAGAEAQLRRAAALRPASAEVSDALAGFYRARGRFTELAEVLRARFAIELDRATAASIALDLADVLGDQLGDRAAALAELERAQLLGGGDLELAGRVTRRRAALDPAAAAAAWQALVDAARARDDHAVEAEALTELAAVLPDRDARLAALRRAVACAPHALRAWLALAEDAADRGDVDAARHARQGGLAGGPSPEQRSELEWALARALLAADPSAADDELAQALTRAAGGAGAAAALAQAQQAELSVRAGLGRVDATARLDAAISSLVLLAERAFAQAPAGAAVDPIIAPALGSSPGIPLIARAATLALRQGELAERDGDAAAAERAFERAHELAAAHAPSVARQAASTLLRRASDARAERRWLDAVLATRPPEEERLGLQLRRAELRLAEPAAGEPIDVAAVLVDVQAVTTTTTDPAVQRRAYELEAQALALAGDRHRRAQVLTARAALPATGPARALAEGEAAAAWLEADDAASALPHGARAVSAMDASLSPAMRRQLLRTLGEAAWRQRSHGEVVLAYVTLLADSSADAGAEVDEAARVQMTYRLAVSLDRSGDRAAARATIAPLLASPPSGALRDAVLRLGAELAERDGDLATAGTALEALAATEDDAVVAVSSRADAWYRAGELHRRRGAVTDATRCLDQALRIVEHHLPALDALEALHRERGDLERVAVILGRKIAATTRQPARQKALLARLGELWRQLGRDEVAQATFARALELDPEYRPALAALAADAEQAGDQATAVAHYVRLAGPLTGDGNDEVAAGRARAEAAIRLGELLDGGAPALAQRHAGEIQALLPGLSGILEPSMLAQLARLLDGLGDGVPRTDDSGARRMPSAPDATARAAAEALDERAELARRAGEFEQARRHLESALALTPGHPPRLRALADLCQQAGDAASAAGHLRSLSDALPPGVGRADVLRELAALYQDKLDDAAAARATRRRAAAAYGADPRGDELLRKLGAEAAASRQWAEMADAYAAIPDGRRASADWVAMATALHRAGEGGQALAVLAEAEAAGALQPEGEMLRMTIVSERDGLLERAALLERRAAGSADAKARLTEALHLYRDVLRDRDGAARVRRALEEAAEDAPPPPPVVTARDRAKALTELAAQARGDGGDLLRATSLLEQAYAADPSYAEAWLPLADACIAADDLERARELFERAAASELPPERRAWASERLAELEALATGGVTTGSIGGRSAAAVASPSTDTAADLPPPPPSMPPLLPPPPPLAAAAPPLVVAQELARARELGNRGDLPAAIERAQAAADAACGDPADERAALELLAWLYDRAGDVEAQIEVLGQLIVGGTDDAERARLWRRRADLHAQLPGHHLEVFRCLREAHRCAPTDATLASMLREHAMARGDWPLVASLLDVELAAAADPRDAGALHVVAAMIHDERLGNRGAARSHLAIALAHDPTIPAALERLAELEADAGEAARAAELLREAAAHGPASRRAELLERAAAADRRAHDDPGSAAAAAADPVTRAHATWQRTPGDDAAYLVLRQDALARGAFDELAQLTAARAAAMPTASDRAALWHGLARLQLELGRPDDAAHSLDRAIIDAPEAADTIAERIDLATDVGDWATADVLLDHLMGRPGEDQPGDADRAAVLVKRAEVAQQLGRNRDALRFAQDAAAAAPERLDAIGRVVELADDLGESALAARAAEAAIEQMRHDDVDAVIAARLGCAALHQRAGDPMAARHQFELVLGDDPQNPIALDGLVAHHRANEEWNLAARYLRTLVARSERADLKASRLLQLGDLYAGPIGDPGAADDCYLRASDLDPGSVAATMRLVDVYWRAGEKGALLDVVVELGQRRALDSNTPAPTLARAAIGLAWAGKATPATLLVGALGDGAAAALASALGELIEPAGELDLRTAVAALADVLGRTQVLVDDVAAAAEALPADRGGPVARALRAR
jgi:Tfp pilus assembly protein PilF